MSAAYFQGKLYFIRQADRLEDDHPTVIRMTKIISLYRELEKFVTDDESKELMRFNRELRSGTDSKSKEELMSVYKKACIDDK